jgi:multiple sugar transport system substrate-binding protein
MTKPQSAKAARLPSTAGNSSRPPAPASRAARCWRCSMPGRRPRKSRERRCAYYSGATSFRRTTRGTTSSPWNGAKRTASRSGWTTFRISKSRRAWPPSTAGAGHDIIYNGSSILTRLYFKNLVDLSDVADAAAKKYGGWIPAAKSLVEVEGRWYGLPIFYILAPMLYRKDLFDANNLTYPDTWELARVAARTLKPKGHPTGIALSQCNDANLFWRSMFWSFGGTEATPSGDQPTIDSKELREFLKFAKAIFEEGMTPEVFSWDDASDNRYLASGIACWVHDAISAYRTTEDTNPGVFQNTFLALEPQGQPGHRVSAAAPNVWMVWKFSKNQQAAKEFLAHLIDNDLEGMVQSRGYNMPYLNDRYKKPMPVIGSDPKLQILQDFPKIVAFYGYPGPSTTAIQEIVNTFIFPDMVTKFCRGQSLEDAIKWGVGEYHRIYTKRRASS